MSKYSRDIGQAEEYAKNIIVAFIQHPAPNQVLIASYFSMCAHYGMAYKNGAVLNQVIDALVESFIRDCAYSVEALSKKFDAQKKGHAPAESTQTRLSQDEVYMITRIGLKVINKWLALARLAEENSEVVADHVVMSAQDPLYCIKTRRVAWLVQVITGSASILISGMRQCVGVTPLQLNRLYAQYRNGLRDVYIMLTSSGNQSIAQSDKSVEELLQTYRAVTKSHLACFYQLGISDKKTDRKIFQEMVQGESYCGNNLLQWVTLIELHDFFKNKVVENKSTELFLYVFSQWRIQPILDLGMGALKHQDIWDLRIAIHRACTDIIEVYEYGGLAASMKSLAVDPSYMQRIIDAARRIESTFTTHYIQMMLDEKDKELGDRIKRDVFPLIPKERRKAMCSILSGCEGVESEERFLRVSLLSFELVQDPQHAGEKIDDLTLLRLPYQSAMMIGTDLTPDASLNRLVELFPLMMKSTADILTAHEVFYSGKKEDFSIMPIPLSMEQPMFRCVIESHKAQRWIEEKLTEAASAHYRTEEGNVFLQDLKKEAIASMCEFLLDAIKVLCSARARKERGLVLRNSMDQYDALFMVLSLALSFLEEKSFLNKNLSDSDLDNYGAIIVLLLRYVAKEKDFSAARKLFRDFKSKTYSHISLLTKEAPSENRQFLFELLSKISADTTGAMLEVLGLSEFVGLSKRLCSGVVSRQWAQAGINAVLSRSGSRSTRAHKNLVFFDLMDFHLDIDSRRRESYVDLFSVKIKSYIVDMLKEVQGGTEESQKATFVLFLKFYHSSIVKTEASPDLRILYTAIFNQSVSDNLSLVLSNEIMGECDRSFLLSAISLGLIIPEKNLTLDKGLVFGEGGSKFKEIKAPIADPKASSAKTGSSEAVPVSAKPAEKVVKDESLSFTISSVFKFICYGSEIKDPRGQIESAIESYGIDSLMDSLFLDLAVACLADNKLFKVSVLCVRLVELGLDSGMSAGFVFKVSGEIVRQWFACFNEQERNESESGESNAVLLSLYKEVKFVLWVITVFKARLKMLNILNVEKRLGGDNGYEFLVCFRKELEEAISIIYRINQSACTGGQVEQGELLGIYANLADHLLSNFIAVTINKDKCSEHRVTYLSAIVGKEADFKHCVIDLQRVKIKALQRLYVRYLESPNLIYAEALVRQWDLNSLARLCTEENTDSVTLNHLIIEWCGSYRRENARDFSDFSLRIDTLLALLTPKSPLKSRAGAAETPLEEAASNDVVVLASLYAGFSAHIYSVLRQTPENRLKYLDMVINIFKRDANFVGARLLQQVAIISSDLNKFALPRELTHIEELLNGLDQCEELLKKGSFIRSYPLIMITVYNVLKFSRFREVAELGKGLMECVRLFPVFTSPKHRLEYDLLENITLALQVGESHGASLKKEYRLKDEKTNSVWRNLQHSAIGIACGLLKDSTEYLLSQDLETRRSLVMREGKVERDEVFTHLYLYLYFLELSKSSPKKSSEESSLLKREYLSVLFSLLHHVDKLYGAEEINNTLRALTVFSYERISEMCSDKGSSKKAFLLSVLSQADGETLSTITQCFPLACFETLVKGVTHSHDAPLWLEHFVKLSCPERANSSVENFEIIERLYQLYLAIPLERRAVYVEVFVECVTNEINTVLFLKEEPPSPESVVSFFKSVVLFFAGMVSDSNKISDQCFYLWMPCIVENVLEVCKEDAPLVDVLGALSTLVDLHEILPERSDESKVDLFKVWVKSLVSAISSNENIYLLKVEKVMFFIKVLALYVNLPKNSQVGFKSEFEEFIGFGALNDLNRGDFSHEQSAVLSAARESGLTLPRSIAPITEAKRANRKKRKAKARARKKALSNEKKLMFIEDKCSHQFREEEREAFEARLMFGEDQHSHQCREEEREAFEARLMFGEDQHSHQCREEGREAFEARLMFVEDQHSHQCREEEREAFETSLMLQADLNVGTREQETLETGLMSAEDINRAVRTEAAGKPDETSLEQKLNVVREELKRDMAKQVRQEVSKCLLQLLERSESAVTMNALITPPGFEKYKGAPLQLNIYDEKSNRVVGFNEGSMFFKDLSVLISRLGREGIYLFAKFIRPDITGSDLDLVLLVEGSLLTDLVLRVLADSSIFTKKVDYGNTLNKFSYKKGRVQVKVDIQTLGIRKKQSPTEALSKYFLDRSICFLETAVLWPLVVNEDGMLSVGDPISKRPKTLSLSEYNACFQEYHATGVLHMNERYYQEELPGKHYISKRSFDRLPADFSAKIRNLLFVFKQLLKARCELKEFEPYANMLYELHGLHSRYVVPAVKKSWFDFLEGSIAHQAAWLKHLMVLWAHNTKPERVADRNLSFFIRCSIDMLHRILGCNIVPGIALVSPYLADTASGQHTTLPTESCIHKAWSTQGYMASANFHSKLLALCLKLEALLHSRSPLRKYSLSITLFIQLYTNPQSSLFAHDFLYDFLTKRLQCRREDSVYKWGEAASHLLSLVVSEKRGTSVFPELRDFSFVILGMLQGVVSRGHPVQCSYRPGLKLDPGCQSFCPSSPDSARPQCLSGVFSPGSTPKRQYVSQDSSAKDRTGSASFSDEFPAL